MLLLQKPKSETIRGFLDEQAQLDFSYHAVGATADNPPSGYVVDHTRELLGEGELTFVAAKSALENWQQFQLGWLAAWPEDAAIEPGQVVAILAHVGVWWLNACRIVHVIDETQPFRRFGFAYGTLPDHAGTGEERFIVEMDDDGKVWYDILAFSKPNHVLARLGYPFVRIIQKRFGRKSAATMKRIVVESLTSKKRDN